VFVNCEGLSSNGRLVNLEEGIFGNNAAIGGDNCTLRKKMVRMLKAYMLGLNSLLRFEEYHQEQRPELQLQRVCHHGEQQPSMREFSLIRRRLNRPGILV
jgi:hypothetical protein